LANSQNYLNQRRAALRTRATNNNQQHISIKLNNQSSTSIVINYTSHSTGKCDMAIRELSVNEVNSVSGAFGPLITAGGGAATGLVIYGLGHRFSGTPMTWQGAAYSAGKGALIGATGGALTAASGGGLAAQLAWQPGLQALSLGLGQYTGHKGW
jgi:hypothetical protein